MRYINKLNINFYIETHKELKTHFKKSYILKNILSKLFFIFLFFKDLQYSSFY